MPGERRRASLGGDVEVSGLAVFFGHLGHAGFGLFLRGGGGIEQPGFFLGREVAHFLADLHAAEFGAAHRAEVGGLGSFGRQGLVVILLGRVGVERQVELVAPAEIEAGAGQRVVAQPRGGVAFRQVGGVGGELVGDDTDLDVVAVVGGVEGDQFGDLGQREAGGGGAADEAEALEVGLVIAADRASFGGRGAWVDRGV